MKFFIFFLYTTVFSFTAETSYSQQKIVIDKDMELTVDEVFKIIKNQTDYRFIYPGNLFDTTPKIELKKGEISLSELLSKKNLGTNINIELSDKNTIILKETKAIKVVSRIQMDQEIRISGIVTDDQGIPLPGVTVVVKGTQNGVQTGFDGDFSIVTKKGDIIVFSYIGMTTQEIVVSDKTVLTVSMVTETSDLEEVIVVGYGKVKRSHLTAAVDQISSEVIENRPISNLSEALQGAVAGLNINAPSGAPEASLNLNIRGFTGFGTSAAPLILVDGIERNINDVNPNDVASVSVLKDGAATAIYGSRAPYGVVLINTKTGKKGQAKITYSGNFRFGKAHNSPVLSSGADFAEYMNEAFRNTRQPAWFGENQIARMRAFAAGDFSNAVFDGIDPAHVPYGVTELSATQWGGHQQAFGNTPWLELAIRDWTPSQQQNISISGGSDNSDYYIGIGYNESNGIFTGAANYKKRYSVLSKINSDITDWMSVGLNINYVRTDESGPNVLGQGRNYGTIWNILARSFPTWVEHNPNDSYYRFNNVAFLSGAGGSEGQDRNDLTLSGNMTIEPIKGLKVNGSLTWRTFNANWQRTTLILEQVFPNGLKAPTQRSATTSGISKRATSSDYYVVDVNASYTKTIAKKHNIFVLIGLQQEEYYNQQLTGAATDFYSNSIQTIATSATPGVPNDRLYDWSTKGFFGRLSYNYAEKYFIEFNIRHDASSRFKIGEKWGTFPSISGAWNIANENFWKIENYISLLKPRFSYSISGNANVDVNGNNQIDPSEYYLFSPQIGISQNQTTILGGEYASVAGLPPLVSNNLTWAKPTTIDFGIDITAFKNRLDFTYDWYQRTVRDQFGPAIPLPEVLGTSVPQSNNAVSETRGWEFKISWRDRAFQLFGKDFKYNVSFRMSDYIGYVVEYEDNLTGATNAGWTKGEIFGQNRHYVSNGIATSLEDLQNNVLQGGWRHPGDLTFQDTNGDGIINSGQNKWNSLGDIVNNGFNYPRKRYGINLGFDWNNFDFSLILDGIAQWTRYTGSMYVWGHNGSQWGAPFFKENNDLGYWRTDNTEAFYPRNQFNGNNRDTANDQYALDLSHLRVRNIRLGYNIPQKWVKKMDLDKIYIYFSGENLGFIYQNSFIKYDPQLLAAANGQGYPPQKVFSFGFNVGL